VYRERNRAEYPTRQHAGNVPPSRAFGDIQGTTDRLLHFDDLLGAPDFSSVVLEVSYGNKLWK
jgi:hypothetical protein